MKFRSQRALLWTANFVIVGGILVTLFLLSENTSEKAWGRHRQRVRDLHDVLSQVSIHEAENVGPPRLGLVAVLDSSSYWSGFVEPSDPAPAIAGPESERIPDPRELVDVLFVAAPTEGLAASTEVGGALVRIKSIPEPQNRFFYRAGDVIGVGAHPETDGDDSDAAIRRHHGIHLLRVTDVGIVCRFAGELVTIRIARNGPPKGIFAATPFTPGGVVTTRASSEDARNQGHRQAAVARVEASVPPGR